MLYIGHATYTSAAVDIVGKTVTLCEHDTTWYKWSKNSDNRPRRRGGQWAFASQTKVTAARSIHTFLHSYATKFPTRYKGPPLIYPQITHSHGAISTPLPTLRILGPTTPNAIQIQSAVFPQIIEQTHRLADKQTITE